MNISDKIIQLAKENNGVVTTAVAGKIQKGHFFQ